MISKKAISPVVATALLLVVAVIAMVGFQSWYQGFQSGHLASISQQSDITGFSSRIEAVMGDNLYFNFGGSTPVNYSQIKVGSITCDTSGELSSGMNTLNLTNCNGNITSGVYDVSLVTDAGFFTERIVISDYGSGSSSSGGDGGSGEPSLDCSALAGGEWVFVPGNSDLGTDDFCVMKYEAKEDSSGACVGGDTNNCPISQAASSPWVSITQTSARSTCASLGEGYSLITDPQWVTVARNAESVASNWDSGTVGSGSMWRGHSDNSPSSALAASSDDNDGYSGTGNSAPSIEKRTLELSTGDILWDLGGNVWEWTNDTFDTNAESSLGQGSSGWVEWTAITGHDYLEPFDSSLDAINGVGRVYAEANDAYPSGTVHAFRRGGGWNSGANAGAFALNLNPAPSYSLTNIGFRCAYAQ